MGRTHRLVLGWFGLLVMCWLLLQRAGSGTAERGGMESLTIGLGAPDGMVLIAGVIGVISMVLLVTGLLRRPTARTHTDDTHAV